MLLKIGELAKRTGLTVRALHHYDDIGLLRPSARSDAGYRLYNRDDIERLHRIQALRRLDLPLTEIAALLESGGPDLQTLLEQQIVSLDRQVMRAAALRDRLKVLLSNVSDRQEPDLSDWLVTLEMMSIYDRYFTREEVDGMCSFDKALMSELSALVTAVRSLMERRVAPDSPEAQALARPWLALSVQHMNDDARLLLKLEAMHRKEAAAQAMTGVDNAVLDYMIDVTAEYRLRLYARHLGADEIAAMRDGYFRNYRRWPALFAELRQLRDDGVDPCGPQAQDLCARWIQLFQDCWGSDPAMREKVLQINALETDIMLGSGLDLELLDFLGRASQHRSQQLLEEQE